VNALFRIPFSLHCSLTIHSLFTLTSINDAALLVHFLDLLSLRRDHPIKSTPLVQKLVGLLDGGGLLCDLFEFAFNFYVISHLVVHRPCWKILLSIIIWMRILVFYM
jgi:hypothetical protein